MLRLVRALLLAMVMLCFVAPPAGAAPTSLEKALGELWTTVLETPTPDNPFAGGDGCVVLESKIVAPLSPDGVDSCTVKRRTSILVSAWTLECSTFEGNGTTEDELRACAVDAGITGTITVDDVSAPVTATETELLTIHLPKDNIFGLKGSDRKGLSVGYGLVYLTDPLATGTHTVAGHAEFADGTTSDFTTTIIVE